MQGPGAWPDADMSCLSPSVSQVQARGALLWGWKSWGWGGFGPLGCPSGHPTPTAVAPLSSLVPPVYHRPPPRPLPLKRPCGGPLLLGPATPCRPHPKSAESDVNSRATLHMPQARFRPVTFSHFLPGWERSGGGQGPGLRRALGGAGSAAVLRGPAVAGASRPRSEL